MPNWSFSELVGLYSKLKPLMMAVNVLTSALVVLPPPFQQHGLQWTEYMMVSIQMLLGQKAMWVQISVVLNQQNQKGMIFQSISHETQIHQVISESKCSNMKWRNQILQKKIQDWHQHTMWWPPCFGMIKGIIKNRTWEPPECRNKCFLNKKRISKSNYNIIFYVNCRVKKSSSNLNISRK